VVSVIVILHSHSLVAVSKVHRVDTEDSLGKVFFGIVSVLVNIQPFGHSSDLVLVLPLLQTL
jgi:hypothetical protein